MTQSAFLTPPTPTALSYKPLAKPLQHVAVVLSADPGLHSVDTWNGLFDVLRAARELGFRYLTLGTCAAGRGERDDPGIHAIADLLRRETQTLTELGVCVQVVGDLDDLPGALRAALEHLIAETSASETSEAGPLTLVLALPGACHSRFVQAARELASSVRAGLLLPEEIDEQIFRRYLGTEHLPDIDLLIHSSCAYRLIDLLPFETRGTRSIGIPVRWPYFGAENFTQALELHG